MTPRARTTRRLALGVTATMGLLASGCTSDSHPAATKYEATIRRTTDGVPHVTSKTVEGVLFGQGFASADDQGCTLADQVIKVRGERSQWFGSGLDDINLKSDLAWRAIGIDQLARSDWPKQSDQVHRFISAFTAGWNQREAKGALTGWCKGAPWVRQLAPEDVYSYARSVMLRASSGALTKYLGSAQPPGSGTSTTTTSTSTATNISFQLDGATPGESGSNGWAIGSERSADGGGMLMANPHLPWEGDLRFWEVQLTVPGKLDVYGAQLVGLPLVGIGFNHHVGWTHTDSSGHRFTAYRLTLSPDDPTTYLVDSVPHKMSSTTTAIKVRTPDGTFRDEKKTLWSSEFGPILDLPGFAWSATTAVAVRDANLHNTAFDEQYYGMDTAGSLEEFQKVHERNQGVPLFNTIATSENGQAWYADTAATPELSAAAEADYRASLASDPVVKAAADNSVILLDGSKSENKWVEEKGARSPGLVPYPKMPKVERPDYLFNANDSFWLSNADHLLEGDYSLMHGDQKVEQSWRTRENATVLRDVSPTGASGADGKFDLDELGAAALADGVYAERMLRPALEQQCDAMTLDTVSIRALTGDDGKEIFRARKFSLAEPCRIIGAWDGTFDLNSRGAVLFREMFNDIPDSGPAVAFDATKPVDTPSGVGTAGSGPSCPGSRRGPGAGTRTDRDRRRGGSLRGHRRAAPRRDPRESRAARPSGAGSSNHLRGACKRR